VDRAVPIWGQPADGTASAKSLKTPLLSELAQLLVCPRVTEDNRAARGDPLCITRFPATYSAWGRVMAEAVARNQWAAVGMVAQTPPPQPRPGTFYQVAAGVVPLYGQTSRAVVVHSNSHAQRRQPRVEREVQAASPPLGTTVRAAAKQAYVCRAAAAAEQLRARQSASPRVAVVIEERPQDGPGRPRQKPPRVVQALRDGLQVTRHERAEVVARKRQEVGGVVLVTHVPTAGERDCGPIKSNTGWSKTLLF
jgi:hypothetical protein